MAYHQRNSKYLFHLMIVTITLSISTSFTTAVNITIITYTKDNHDNIHLPYAAALEVIIFEDIASKYTELFKNISVSHIPLLYHAPFLNRTSLDLDKAAATEVGVFFEFYYANQHLFPSDYSERFTAVVTDCRQTLPSLKNFVREVPVLLAAIDPQDSSSGSTVSSSYLNLIPTRDSHLFAAIQVLAERFKWTKITIVCDCDRSFPPINDQICERVYHDNLCSENQEHSALVGKTKFLSTMLGIPQEITIKNVFLRNNRVLKRDFDRPLDVAMKFKSRVILLLLQPNLVRSEMIRAFHKKLINNEGDYVFITIQEPVNDISKYVQWKANDEDDSVAAVAFNSLIVITKMSPNRTRIKSFIERVSVKAIASNLEFSSALDTLLNEFPSIEFLDEIPLIFEALNRLSKDLPLLNPVTFVEKMRNNSYESLSGQVRLDSSGMVVLPILMLRFDQITMAMKTAARIDPLTGVISENNQNSFLWFGHSELPPDLPKCGPRLEACPLLFYQQEITWATSSSLCIFSAIALALFLWMRYKTLRQKFNHVFLDEWTEVTWLDFVSDPIAEELLGSKATLGNTDVYAKKITTSLTLRQARRNPKLCAALLMVENVKHPNLTRFFGISFNPQTRFCLLCTEFSERGSLNSVTMKGLHNTVMTDVKFRLSFMADIIEAVTCIHKSILKFHGGLDSSVCLVTSRFAIRVAQTGFRQLVPLLTGSAKPGSKGTRNTALRSDQAKDIYAVGIILGELFACTDSITNSPSTRMPKELQELIKSCGSSIANEQIRAADLQRVIRRNIKASFSVTSHLMFQLEKHAEALEISVQERTVILSKEKEKVDILLEQMLPASVIAQLRNQTTVIAELFESATVLFSDIPIFSEIATKHAPWEAVKFLNAIYTVFDEILTLYDVYKVETINDSYVVTSGIPIRNGTRHASEICALSLHLRDAAKMLQITLTEHITVSVRIGINSGTIAAGIVGTRMPRYCLFGDAMNTASRMESHGKEDKVHVGATTKNLANISGCYNFDFECRGLVEIKGKGPTETYWLSRSSLTPNFQ